jgi:hypothetical protein
MNRAYALIQAAFVAIPLPAQQVFAQGMKDVIGTWTAVSNETTLADGKKIQPFGSKPVGILTFDPEGRYALQLCSPDRPKFSSNNRVQGTPEEYKAAVHGCNPHWGRYSVDGGNIVFKIEHAMFPNWEGTEQKRPFTIKGDELTYKVPTASTGGTAELVWRRAN